MPEPGPDPTTLTDARAREAVADALLRIVPDADLAEVGDDGVLRSELELDSLDFLSLRRAAQLHDRGADRRGRLPGAAHDALLYRVPHSLTGAHRSLRSGLPDPLCRATPRHTRLRGSGPR